MKTIYIVLIAIIIIIAFVMALIMVASNTRTKYGGKSIFEQMNPDISDPADSDAPKKEGWEEWVELAQSGSQQEESSEQPAEDAKEHMEEDKKADAPDPSEEDPKAH